MRCCTATLYLLLLLALMQHSKAAGPAAGADSTDAVGTRTGTVDLVVDARPAAAAAAAGGGTATAFAASRGGDDASVAAAAADTPPPAKRSRHLPSDEELAALQQALKYDF